MNIEPRPLREVVTDAMRILTEQLGPANTARFIHHFSVGFGDYTEARGKLFAGYSVDEICAEIEEGRRKQGA